MNYIIVRPVGVQFSCQAMNDKTILRQRIVVKRPKEITG
jgi:hypothetical protein